MYKECVILIAMLQRTRNKQNKERKPNTHFSSDRHYWLMGTIYGLSMNRQFVDRSVIGHLESIQLTSLDLLVRDDRCAQWPVDQLTNCSPLLSSKTKNNF